VLLLPYCQAYSPCWLYPRTTKNIYKTNGIRHIGWSNGRVLLEFCDVSHLLRGTEDFHWVGELARLFFFFYQTFTSNYFYFLPFPWSIHDVGEYHEYSFPTPMHLFLLKTLLYFSSFASSLSLNPYLLLERIKLGS
jgi:hypothetical protein